MSKVRMFQSVFSICFHVIQHSSSSGQIQASIYKYYDKISLIGRLQL